MPTTDFSTIRVTTADYDSLEFGNLKKGVHFHEFEGKKFDVDTFYDGEIYYGKIVRQDKELHYKVWHFDCEDFECPVCNKPLDIKFNIQRTGVMARCFYCNVTRQAVEYNTESHEDIAEIVQDKIVSIAEAKAICKRIGQNPIHLGLEEPRPRRRPKPQTKDEGSQNAVAK